MDSETLTELFQRNPLDKSLTSEELDAMIQHFREARKNFKVSGKAAPDKKAVNLAELGLL